MPSYIDQSGVEVFYDFYPSNNEPRAVIQLLHGVGEHAGRYQELIDALTDAGYSVYADDHRGHGRTGLAQHGGDSSKLGRLGSGGMAATKAALWQFTELIRANHPGVPLVLLGHSWGSFLAQMLLNEHPDAYDALVLSGSSYRWPGSLNSGDLNAPWRGAGATGTEWLSSDLSVGEAFSADPLTTSEPLLKLFGPLNALALYGKPARDLPSQLPVLLMVGRDDTVGGPKSVHRLARAYRERSGLVDVKVLVYPDARHEIFNDHSKDRVRRDLLAWLDQHFPA